MKGRFRSSTLVVIIVLCLACMKLIPLLYSSNVLRRNSVPHSISTSTAPSVNDSEYSYFTTDKHYVLGTSFNGRLGNQLFVFAATVYIAIHTGRFVVLHNSTAIANWFQVESVIKISDVDTELCPCFRALDNFSMTFERSLIESTGSHVRYKTILLKGSFYSLDIVSRVDEDLRRYLQPLPSLSADVDQFFGDVRPRHWISPISDGKSAPSYRRIGIHVRAGDTLTTKLQLLGYVIPKQVYFERAMWRVIAEDDRRQGSHGRGSKVGYLSRGVPTTLTSNALQRIQFIVSSDSVDWARRTYMFESIAANISAKLRSLSGSVSHVDVDIMYSTGREEGFDLLMLSRCDALVITHGAFGWWAAWLGNRTRTVVYFTGSPRKGSLLHGKVPRSNFYPTSWIGLDDVTS